MKPFRWAELILIPAMVAVASGEPAPGAEKAERDVTGLGFGVRAAQAAQTSDVAPPQAASQSNPVQTATWGTETGQSQGATNRELLASMPPIPASMQAMHRPSGTKVTLFFNNNTLEEVCSVLSASIGRPVIHRSVSAARVTRTYMGMRVREVLDDLCANYPVSFTDDDKALVMHDLVPVSMEMRPKAAVANLPAVKPLTEVAKARMPKRKSLSDPLIAAELAKERWQLLAERAGGTAPDAETLDPKSAAAAALAKERWELLNDRASESAIKLPDETKKRKPDDF